MYKTVQNGFVQTRKSKNCAFCSCTPFADISAYGKGEIATNSAKPCRTVQIVFLQGKRKGVYKDVHDRRALLLLYKLARAKTTLFALALHLPISRLTERVKATRIYLVCS